MDPERALPDLRSEVRNQGLADAPGGILAHTRPAIAPSRRESLSATCEHEPKAQTSGVRRHARAAGTLPVRYGVSSVRSTAASPRSNIHTRIR